MNKVLQITLLFAFFGVLILIRVFENELFYDPYLSFFKNDYLYIDNPRREILKLTLFTSLRFLLNTVMSLGILYLFFKNKGIIKFATLVYVLAFSILIILYLYFVINPKQGDYYIFFNIRRFLIQPLLLLILWPAFYYNQLQSKKS